MAYPIHGWEIHRSGTDNTWVSHVRPSKMRAGIGILFSRNTGREEILGVKKRTRNPEAFGSIDNHDDYSQFIRNIKEYFETSPHHSGLHSKKIVNSLPWLHIESARGVCQKYSVPAYRELGHLLKLTTKYPLLRYWADLKFYASCAAAQSRRRTRSGWKSRREK